MRGLLVVCGVVLAVMTVVVGLLVGLVWLSARCMADAERAEATDDPWLGPRTIPGRRP